MVLLPMVGEKQFFFPLRKERRSWQNCLLMILSESKEQVLFSNGVSTFRYLLYMKITPIYCGYRTFSNTIILLLFSKPLTWVKQLFSRNYFKTKQKGLTWRRLYWQSLFMILKKQYLWYLSTRDVVGNVSKQGRFIKLNVLCWINIWCTLLYNADLLYYVLSLLFLSHSKRIWHW